MTFFTLVLIVVIILAVIGLGWQTFTVAVLDGFDRTLDVGIPIIKNLTSEAQEAQASTIEIPKYQPGIGIGLTAFMPPDGIEVFDYDNTTGGLVQLPLENIRPINMTLYKNCIEAPNILEASVRHANETAISTNVMNFMDIPFSQRQNETFLQERNERTLQNVLGNLTMDQKIALGMDICLMGQQIVQDLGLEGVTNTQPTLPPLGR